MFNIEFGGSNSAQIAVAQFKAGGAEMETLYARPEDMKKLKALLQDVRHMPMAEFNDVIAAINATGGLICSYD